MANGDGSYRDLVGGGIGVIGPNLAHIKPKQGRKTPTMAGLGRDLVVATGEGGCMLSWLVVAAAIAVSYRPWLQVGPKGQLWPFGPQS